MPIASTRVTTTTTPQSFNGLEQILDGELQRTHKGIRKTAEGATETVGPVELTRLSQLGPDFDVSR